MAKAATKLRLADASLSKAATSYEDCLGEAQMFFEVLR